MTLTPGRGYEALRRGRWSTPRAKYFLTFCTENRAPGLMQPNVLSGLLATGQQLDSEAVWHLRTTVVMPDHIHLLVSLGDTAELTGAVRLFKGRLAPVLRRSALSWQKAYFDHRLRPDEDVLPLFLYIFLNPYRARLLDGTERWPGYYCCEEDWKWFEPLTNASVPFPEWLD